jgi:ABC-type glycerol-3-phosphate transport system permease component
MMAAATMTAAPVVLGFAAAQRYLVDGLTKGALRG